MGKYAGLLFTLHSSCGLIELYIIAVTTSALEPSQNDYICFPFFLLVTLMGRLGQVYLTFSHSSEIYETKWWRVLAHFKGFRKCGLWRGANLGVAT